MNNQALTRKQLDRQLEVWRKLTPYKRPVKGWVKTIRKALGMTSEQLAKRAGVHRARIVQLEHAEPDDALTLRSLRSIAEKMDCDLVYAIVPRQPLFVLLEERSLKIAKRRVAKVSHSMSLEDQAVSVAQREEQIKELAKKLLEKSLKYLWGDE